MKAEDGKDFTVGAGSNISLYDWDKDGKPDLFIGTIEGGLWYAKNLGGGVVAAGVQVKGGGKEFEAPDGGPCVADWDGDGVADVFVGMESGEMIYAKGIKGDGPNFGEPVTVLPSLTLHEADPVLANETGPLDWDIKRPGMRPKPFVTDWNGDGKLDLLVGDMRILSGRNDKLTPEQAAKYKTLKAKQDTLKTEAEKHYDALKVATLKKLGWNADRKLTVDESSKYSEEFAKLYEQDKEAVKIDEELSKIFDEIQPLNPPTDYHGFVWLFLRK